MGGMQQNPMMMNQMAMMPVMPMGGSGLSYQNPNHNNSNMYNQFNPMKNDQGPSLESWGKDARDMGKNFGTQAKKNTDTIKEFQDLFELGTSKI